jgi:hypothetical protein
VLVQFLEGERRKKDIDLIEPSHPLLPLSLDCLKDRDTERPSADELCGRLASLKGEPRYTHSVEQTRGHIQRLQEEINMKDDELEGARADLQTANNIQREKEELIQTLQERATTLEGEIEIKEESARADNNLLQEKEKLVQRLQERVEALEMELHTSREEGKSADELVCDSSQLHTPCTGDLGDYLVSIPTSQGECEGPVVLTWRQGQPAPETMTSYWGAAVVHGNTAYFSRGHMVYLFTVRGNKWTKLPECMYKYFVLAVVNDTLTTVGGEDCQGKVTNTLLGLSESSWEEVLPPMPTERMHPAAAATPTHLVVAGGQQTWDSLATVEVLNTETLQWFTASSLPETATYPKMTLCGAHGCVYVANEDGSIFSCSVEDLKFKADPSQNETRRDSDNSMWTKLASIPVENSSLATLKGHVLAIGGSDSDGFSTRAIHLLDVATNSWSVVGEMPTPRLWALTVVLPHNDLVVVGGELLSGDYASITEVCGCCTSP